MTTTQLSSTPSTEESRIHGLIDELLAQHAPSKVSPREFLGAQYDAGLAWVHFPIGFGGLGLSPKHQRVINERLFAAGAPNPQARNPIGHGMCAPTVVEWGSDAQRSRYLRPLFTGEEVWCQLFSEPGSGSDFAGLSARGVQDGDEWICNGQKVWTTLAHLAKWGLLVVRTDTETVKHAGLTAFVVDMEAPGVEVRPLRQMTGEAEFNEVYFTDVRIPQHEMLGKPGDGWRVSLTTLMNERVSIGGTTPPRGSGPIGQAVKKWHELSSDAHTIVKRDELAKLWIRAEVL
ncbi:MAG: acyl-CoA dehydrogenase family protein, partial [Actinomycetota bacterium]